jgi:hypothetical protein
MPTLPAFVITILCVDVVEEPVAAVQNVKFDEELPSSYAII